MQTGGAMKASGQQQGADTHPHKYGHMITILLHDCVR